MNSRLFASLALFLAIIGTTLGCVQKSFGPQRTVCVCNEQNCDSVGTAKDGVPKRGHAVLYYSSQSGKRFQRKLIKEHEKGKTMLESIPLANMMTKHNEAVHNIEHFLATAHNKSNINVLINASVKYQKIHGFGGAFTDSAGINILKLPPALQDRLLEDYFGPTGIEYSLGRVPIASTDFSLRQYSYADVPGDAALTTFSLAEDDHLYKIPFIKKALKLTKNKLKLFSSPWSAPAWMKDNKDMSHGGKLLDEYQQSFANYYVRFFEEYKKQGISFWATTVLNEPQMATPEWRWQSMNFTAATESAFVKNCLGPALKKNIATKAITIIGLDDVTYQMDKWIDTALAEKEAAKYYGGFGVHWYWNYWKNNTFTKTLDAVHRSYPDKFVISTEACAMYLESSGPSPGNWTNAMLYASDIIDNLNNHVTGWVDWNIALDMKGGPNWANNRVDAPILVNAEKAEYYKQPLYYSMGHFSKFIRPGSMRIASKIENRSAAVQTIAFKAPNGKTVVVLYNKDKKKSHSFSISDSKRMKMEYHVSMEPQSLATLIF